MISIGILFLQFLRSRRRRRLQTATPNYKGRYYFIICLGRQSFGNRLRCVAVVPVLLSSLFCVLSFHWPLREQIQAKPPEGGQQLFKHIDSYVGRKLEPGKEYSLQPLPIRPKSQEQLADRSVEHALMHDNK